MRNRVANIIEVFPLSDKRGTVPLNIKIIVALIKIDREETKLIKHL